jgi:plastocyanin
MFVLAATPSLAPPPPARVLTFANEYRFSSSRARFPAGRLVLQLKNIGQDDHDLRLVGPKGTARAETGIVRPGHLGEIRVALPRGTYTYLCTVADHASRGMTGTFVVTARKKGKR